MARSNTSTECQSRIRWRRFTTIYFAPKASEGQEGNWLQTIPGKSWWIGLRMYGPEQPWIDKTWRPGEIELVK
ncbi:DUF1214 domain-containing protein [Roseimaritima multifibrata]|uniref:DUF1214 domain-containing protein n=1 Tax=Roseimaritima multifibrata TaxID=1930274 RepID=UPI001FE7D144|nr:DUF1214 domain-containing protein [Roseimaritima multifibrata]